MDRTDFALTLGGMEAAIAELSRAFDDGELDGAQMVDRSVWAIEESLQRVASSVPRRGSGLADEILPAASTGVSSLGGDDAELPNPDPLPHLVGLSDEGRFAEVMEEHWGTVGGERVTTARSIFGPGWEVVAGSARTQDAADLRDWVEAWLLRPQLGLGNALDALWQAYLVGWGPYQVLWRDWTWSRVVTSRRRSRTHLVPHAIIDKPHRVVRWTRSRKLVVRDGVVRRLYQPHENVEDRMVWLTPCRATADNPYGKGLYRQSGIGSAYVLWKTWQKQWALALDRSMGVLLVEPTNQITGGLDAKAEEADLQGMVNRLNSSGVMRPPRGYKVGWMDNIPAYTQGWEVPFSRLDRIVTRGMSGQSLSFQLGSDAAGSRAAAQVEEGRSRVGYAQMARWLSTECIQPLIDQAVAWNWGDVPQDLRPRLRLGVERHLEPDALRTYVELARQVGDAPAPDFEAVARAWGVPIDPDVTIDRQAPPAVAPEPAGSAEGESDPAQPPEPPAPAATPRGGA